MESEQVQPQFPATLDTVLRPQYGHAAHTIRTALLTSKQTVLTDAQLLDCKGLRELIDNGSFAEALQANDGDGNSPFLACTRAPFDKVLFDWLVHREKPVRFSSFSTEFNDEVRKTYWGRTTSPNTLGPFFDVCMRNGIDFEKYLLKLNECFPAHRCKSMKKLHESYAPLVYERATQWAAEQEKWIQQLRDKPGETSGDAIFLAENHLSLCSAVRAAIDAGEANRTEFYDAVKSVPVNEDTKRFFQREVLDYPYNLNFCESQEFNQIDGEERYLEDRRGPDAEKIFGSVEFDPDDEMDQLPFDIAQVPLETILRIRQNQDFQESLRKLANPDNPVEAIKRHMRVLAGSVQRPAGVLKKMQLVVVRARRGDTLRNALSAEGLGRADIMPYLLGLGTFAMTRIEPELSEHQVIGLLLGLAAHFSSEKIKEEILSRSRKKEFAHVVRLLIQQTQGSIASNSNAGEANELTKS